MGVGNLHKVVLFRKNTPGTLGAGGSDSYSDLLTTRGSLKKINGSRGLSFGEVLESNSYELIVRVQTLLEQNLRTDLRVVIEGRTFTISSWDKMDEKRFYYKIILNEQRN